MSKNSIYSDISITFDKNPLTDDVLKVKDDISIKQSIKILVLTYLNERPFQKNKGSRIKKLLFDLKRSEVKDYVSSEIQNLILNYEPRANFVGMEYVSNESDNYVSIKIFFSIQNSLNIDEVDISLERIR